MKAEDGGRVSPELLNESLNSYTSFSILHPKMTTQPPSPSGPKNVKSSRKPFLLPSESALPNFMRKLSSSQQQLRAADLRAAEINLGLERMT